MTAPAAPSRAMLVAAASSSVTSASGQCIVTDVTLAVHQEEVRPGSITLDHRGRQWRESMMAYLEVDPARQEASARTGPEHVRIDLAANPCLTRAVGEVLTADVCIPVRSALARSTMHHGVMDQLAQDPSPQVRAGLARNPTLPVDLVDDLSADPSVLVRASLARRPLPLDLQLTLMSDSSPTVRNALASNHSLVPEVFTELLARWSHQFDPPTVTRVLDHPALTLTPRLPAWWFTWAESGPAPAYRAQALAGCDPAVLTLLEPTWVGTLGELRAAVLAFGPTPAAGFA